MNKTLRLPAISVITVAVIIAIKLKINVISAHANNEKFAFGFTNNIMSIFEIVFTKIANNVNIAKYLVDIVMLIYSPFVLILFTIKYTKAINKNISAGCNEPELNT
ncbi:hypothetical protein AGMMS49992_31740 [Clostridia bacterium]|nr:hypothetical protein AGMMS49992_31740 [Clostridia bacterium]